MRGRILWVDDEIDLLKPHILYLEDKGYNVYAVTNGYDAVSSVNQGSFDLVLLDQTMPGKDGIDTLRELKDIQPALPVILITKIEEEWLMDEAISEKTSDYLTKPVNPSQIFLACKKVLEEEKILDEKATSGYLKDFREIEKSISAEMGADDWWSLHVKLVNWQIEMDKRSDNSLGEILEEQLRDSNRQFTQFITDKYRHWLHSGYNNRPPLSMDVLRKFVVPSLKNDEKVFLLVVDCFRLDQFITILPEIQKYYNVELDYHISLLPSATPFCRNAIFSGKSLGQIKKLHPGMWKSLQTKEQSINRFENELLLWALQSYGLKNTPAVYYKVTMAREGKSFLHRITDYLNTSLLALVVNFVDLLAHNRSESEILQDLMPNEAGYRATVKTWFENSWLFDVLKIVSETSFKIVLTSDHGSIRVRRGVQIPGDKGTSQGIRYKYGKNLKCPEKFGMVIKRPEDYLLPDFIPGTNYIIAKDDVYFVYPTQYHKYLKLYQNSFQHGGISMEEMLVPTATLSAK